MRTGLPTLMAAAGVPDVKEKLLTGYQSSEKTFKVHLDGYNLMTYSRGKDEDPRKEFLYWTDDGDFAGSPVRKMENTFSWNSAPTGSPSGANPLIPLRVPYSDDSARRSVRARLPTKLRTTTTG